MTCPWTEDRVATLKRLWVDGLSATEVARALGAVSRNAVLGKLHRLGLLGGRVRRSAPRPQPVNARRATRPCAKPVRRRDPGAARDPELNGLVARLEDLGPDGCHWPLGDPKRPDFRLCGRPAGAGPYCPAHRAVAYLGVDRAGDREPRRRA